MPSITKDFKCEYVSTLNANPSTPIRKFSTPNVRDRVRKTQLFKSPDTRSCKAEEITISHNSHSDTDASQVCVEKERIVSDEMRKPVIIKEPSSTEPLNSDLHLFIAPHVPEHIEEHQLFESNSSPKSSPVIRNDC